MSNKIHARVFFEQEYPDFVPTNYAEGTIVPRIGSSERMSYMARVTRMLQEAFHGTTDTINTTLAEFMSMMSTRN